MPEDGKLPTRAQVVYLAEIVAELEYRSRAKALLPDYVRTRDDIKLAAILCRHTGLQPSEFHKLSAHDRIPFLDLVLEEKGIKTKKVAKLPTVVLQGQGKDIVVNGKIKTKLTTAQYNVVGALIEAGANGLNKDQLPLKSGHADAVKIAKRIYAIDKDWQSVIGLPGKPGGKYRILGNHH